MRRQARVAAASTSLMGNVFLRAEYEFVQFAPVANLVVSVNTVRGGLGVKF